jgi:hypothetical protein
MAKKIFLRQIPNDQRQTSDILAEIRALYFKASAKTIEKDFDRAIDLLKTMANEGDRERATVFMQGLTEMKAEWRRKTGPKSKQRTT